MEEKLYCRMQSSPLEVTVHQRWENKKGGVKVEQHFKQLMLVVRDRNLPKELKEHHQFCPSYAVGVHVVWIKQIPPQD